MTKQEQDVDYTPVSGDSLETGAPVKKTSRVSSSPPLVSVEMRGAGAAVLERLSGVIGSEDLAERVYIAMASVPI